MNPPMILIRFNENPPNEISLNLRVPTEIHNPVGQVNHLYSRSI